jgi:hypothetical protein
MAYFSYKGQSCHFQRTLENIFTSIAVRTLIPEVLREGTPSYSTYSVTVLIGEDIVRTKTRENESLRIRNTTCWFINKGTVEMCEKSVIMRKSGPILSTLCCPPQRHYGLTILTAWSKGGVPTVTTGTLGDEDMAKPETGIFLVRWMQVGRQ